MPHHKMKHDFNDIYDVIIVGGGLAGLAAASQLQDKSICVLESDGQLGGRVFSKTHDDVNLDLGACFAFDLRLIPFPLKSDTGELIKEQGPLGISLDGTIYFSETPKTCLEKMELDQDTWQSLVAFALGECDAKDLVSTRAYSLLNALFHQIHPGDIIDYAPEIQRQGLDVWFPNHWQAGNGILVDSFLANNNATLHLNSEVSVVCVRPECVEVKYMNSDEEYCLYSRSVVLATPANIAAQLTTPSDSECGKFLETVNYAGFFVVAIYGIDAEKLPKFRCIVAVDQTLSMVIQQCSADRKQSVLLCYYSESVLSQVSSLNDEDIYSLTCSELIDIGLNPGIVDKVGGFYVKRWVQAGTILSSETLGGRKDSCRRPCDRVVLAGDYLSGMGYGINDAVSSGLAAASLVQKYLN